MAWSCSSRAVVAMQLAAWSVAGVLLLHRGLSTLAKDGADLEGWLSANPRAAQDSRLHAEAWKEALAKRRAARFPGDGVESADGNATSLDWGGAGNSTLEAEAGYNDTLALADYGDGWNGTEGGNGRGNATSLGEMPARKMRPTALVYVALGLLVLAVGPAIVAFKSCDERTRPAFQKVVTQDPHEVEAPPSYESAVGEPAPRYSTLFGSQVRLDFLATPPPPPPPPPPPVPPDADSHDVHEVTSSTALLVAPPSCCEDCRRDS